MEDFLNSDKKILIHGNKLPHWQQGEVMQFVTFRLGDAMPQSTLSVWAQERTIWLKCHPKPWDKKTTQKYHHRFTAQLETWLDHGAGSCLLKNPTTRKILEETLIYDQETRAEQHAWVIRPNHVHLLFTPKAPLPVLLKSWKGISARKIKLGSIWQKNYRDTLIRDANHFANAVRYIRGNPAKLAPTTYTLWQGARALTVQ